MQFCQPSQAIRAQDRLERNIRVLRVAFPSSRSPGLSSISSTWTKTGVKGCPAGLPDSVRANPIARIGLFFFLPLYIYLFTAWHPFSDFLAIRIYAYLSFEWIVCRMIYVTTSFLINRLIFDILNDANDWYI